MNFKETGFRAFYHQICALELNDMLREIIKDCPEADKASHVVVYGYIDQEKGLMLEVLGAGKQAPKYFYFKEPYEEGSIKISISSVVDVPFVWFEKLEKKFQKKFAPKIEALKEYDASENVEKSREFGFLDECREPEFPDDVRVRFVKEGLKTEECWVRITDLGDHCLIGKLLNQPYQDFGVNLGDTITFYAEKEDDESIYCMAPFDTEKFTREDLADGTILKGAMEDALKDKKEETLAFVFALLRSSHVFIACDVDGDQVKPRILSNNEDSFLPAFTNVEEGEGKMEADTFYEMSFVNAMEFTKEEPDLKGIVVNAFTTNFIVTRDIFDVIADMTPLVEEEDTPVEGLSTGVGEERFGDSDDLQIAVGKMDVFNYAFYQNRVPPIRGVVIINQTGDTVDGLTLHIYSDTSIFNEYEVPLPPIPSGKPVMLDDPTLVINGHALADLTEMINATMTVELRKNGESVCGCRGQMKVLAYDQWQGGESYRDLLPAFVLPNHPLIPALMHEAADRLKKWGKPTSLEGYQMGDPNRVRDLAAAAYAVIQKKNIVYAEPPASFDVAGQRIRTPEVIMEQRLGTCMDMTLLYAACLEAMGLHPLLVMLSGHIFAGVWLKERSPEELIKSDIIIENSEELLARIDNGIDELTFVECTAMCSGKQVDFETAEKAAKYGNLANKDAFRFAIDVACARIQEIKPIPSRVSKSGSYQINMEEVDEAEVTAAPTNLGISIAPTVAAKPKKITSKRELWESKLLDLSLHNMLLNLPLNASVMPLMSSHIDELEDALADGHEFNVLPAADWITGLSYSTQDESGKKSEPKVWLAEALKEVGVFELTHWPAGEDFDFNEKFRQEYRNHRLYTYCGEKQLGKELTTIYRAARSAQQENGVSSLYLAIGLMRWFPDPDSSTPSYAPLILLPIEIIRKSANQGYGLHARDEEPHFNSTLLEMLKEQYNLDIAGLDPLPLDAHGVDIKKVFAIVRGALYSLKDWDVVESCVIGNFSFAQFAMWNDVHTGGEMLDNSNIVRSLMKGHIDWDANLPENLDEEEAYLPITVDATQLKAIKLAAHGSTFVLHGPPGTGKSQTITGMIANLLAKGKKVLFVAEKMAALSVVERRLASLGIGDFCLELHSNKANKKQVLAQLEHALSIKQPSNQTEYAEQLQRATASREKLDDYAQHLHAKRNSGFSLRDLIDLYESVRDEEQMIRFDSFEAGQLSHSDIQKHLPLMSQLTAAGATVGELKDHPLSGVGLNSYSAEVRGALHEHVGAYAKALNAISEIGPNAASFLNQDKPSRRDDYEKLNNSISLFSFYKEVNTELMDSLEKCKDKLLAYFAKEKEVLIEKEGLLTVWTEEFLSRNTAEYKEKHANAEKKLFGKTGAMQSLISELQAYSLHPVAFDKIPVYMQVVDKYQADANALRAYRDSLGQDEKKLLEQFPTEQAFYKAYENTGNFNKKMAEFPGGIEAVRLLETNQEAQKTFADYQTIYKSFVQEESAFNSLLKRQTNDSDDWVTEEIAFCNYIKDHAASLKNWGLYNQIREECLKVGLKPVVSAYENHEISGDLTGPYKKGLYYALINEIILSDDVLSSFSGVTFNESIQHFKRLDDKMLDQTKSEIFYLLASRVPDAWSSPEIGAELSLLRKAIGSNARGMSIRALFERIPNVLQMLCPCMLMSPNSVAQYLKQDNNLFDVVIFDEASQLPTCKAVGALSRAKDAVIVGDPKQMPPTSFFAGSGPNVEDLALADLDSILDDALALGIPSQFLQWHYRSTHESLIAFSNNQFYENKMYTFPSANDRERHVTAIHVDGVYKSGTNIKEAEAVVAEIVRRFNDPELKKQSIGVVTFNIKQQNLIEDLLTKQFQNNTELDSWATSGEDPIFVKNLENVQGDERDAIIFSICYGPDEKGRVSMNFGPINQSGGGKRLNVAFSRARVSMTIFSSIYSSDLKLTDSSPEGVVAFRNFLRFAEGHELASEASYGSSDQSINKDGILQTICHEITKNGFKCETMVGHSNFHVDIAVIDPNEPTEYMMGILLDGDSYKQTKNARDREVAQIGVLKNLGWKLHRVWTIDWWDNRENELRKLIEMLNKLKQESDKRFEAKQEKEASLEEKKEKLEEKENELKTELEKQAQEVVADEQEAEKAEKEVRVVIDTPVAAPDAEAQVSDDNSDKILSLINKLNTAGASVIDKRANGGALWIAGGEDIASIIDEFEEIGIHFIFKKGGGKATGGKDGWWARTDVVLPNVSQESVSEIPEPEEETVPEQEPSAKEPAPPIEPDPETREEPATLPEQQEDQTEKSIPTEKTQLGEPIPYKYAELPALEMTSEEYTNTKNRGLIGERALAIIDAEAPILKEALIRKIMSSCGVNKSGATKEATEKALKSVKIKSAKQKGIVFCWAPGQDPNDYKEIRVSNERAGNEICPQELRNAICYVLREKGELDKDALIKETSLLFGYKRLGKKLEADIFAGVQFARASKAIVYVPGGKFTLPE